MVERKDISISKKWFDLISERIQNSENEFNSVNEYVDYVLEQVFSENIDSYTDDERAEIEKNLKDLGYM